MSREKTNQRSPGDGPERVSEIAQAPEYSANEGPLIVFMRRVDSPEAEARLNRALRLILKAAGRDGRSD